MPKGLLYICLGWGLIGALGVLFLPNKYYWPIVGGVGMATGIAGVAYRRADGGDKDYE